MPGRVEGPVTFSSSAVWSLASAEARYITGVTLPVEAGSTTK